VEISNTEKSLSKDTLKSLQRWLVNYVTQTMLSTPMENQTNGQVNSLLEEAYDRSKATLPDDLKAKLFEDVLNEINGYGPIDELLQDSTVTEIMVNSPKSVFIERNGLLQRTEVEFPNEEAILQLIHKIILPLGRRIDANSPTVDARLPDGSRVNAVIPPVAVDSPGITIRKFSKEKLQVEDLIEFGSLSEHMAEFIRACVVARLNILVSGGTGSGKTTLLNILSSFIPENERIITIEDAAELQLHQEHVYRLEAKTADIDGEGEITIRHLVRNSLRMRPDRILIGEVRGGESLDMLQAMNTGHDGSLTTLHANTPRDAVSRLETMILLGGIDFPIRVVRGQIASALDLIIQQSRFRDGSRKVTSITEVIGMEGEVVVLNELFNFQESGVDENDIVIGEFRATGMRPMFEGKLEIAGIKLSPGIYSSNLIELNSLVRQ